MADWLNHVAIAAPRNGTTTHTVTPSSGSAVFGTLFTPTAGRLLVCVVEGSVTSTTPSGWTLPTGGSAINNTGLYVWYRTAAGSDSLTTTHNGSNYPVMFHFFEFASGSTFSGSAASTGVSRSGGAGPTLSGLTGTNWTAGVVGQAGNGMTGNSTYISWSAGTELADSVLGNSGTDGYAYGLTATDANTASSASYAATMTANTTDTTERLVFAVKIPSGGTQYSGAAAMSSGSALAAGAGLVAAAAAALTSGSSMSGTLTSAGLPAVGFNTAEGLSDTTVPTTGNTGGTSGTAANSVAVASGDSIQARTAAAAHGSVGYRFGLIAGGAGATRMLWSYAVATRMIFSFYVKVDTLPSATEDLGGIRNSTGNMGILTIGADGKAVMNNAAGTGVAASKATNTFPVGTWVRVDIIATKGTGTGDGTLGYAYFENESDTPTFSWESAAQNAGTTNSATGFIGRSTGRSQAHTFDYDTVRWATATSGYFNHYSAAANYAGAAALTSGSSFGGGAAVQAAAAAALTSGSSFGGTAPVQAAAAATFASGSSLTAAGVRGTPGAAALVSGSSLTADGPTVRPAAATLTSASALTSAATAIRTAATTMTSGSSFSGGSPALVRAGAAALTSGSALTAGATRAFASAAALTSGSSLTSNATRNLPLAAAMSSGSSLTGDGRVMNFVGALRYDWDDGTVQGWAAGAGSMTPVNVAQKLRTQAFMALAGAGHMYSVWDNATMRGGVISGSDTLAAVLTLASSGVGPSGPWNVELRYRAADGMTWVAPTTVWYRRTDTREWVSGLIPDVPVQVLCQFSGGIPTIATALGTYVTNPATSPSGTLTIDQDNFRQGSFVEALTASCHMTSGSSFGGGTVPIAGTAALSSGSSFGADSTATKPVSSAMVSGSAFSSDTAGSRPAAAALTSGSSFGAQVMLLASATMTSGSSFTSAALRTLKVAAALIGGSTFGGSGVPLRPGTVTMTSGSAFSAVPTSAATGAALTSGSSFTGSVPVYLGAVAALISGSNLAGSDTAIRPSDAMWTSASVLVAGTKLGMQLAAAMHSGSALILHTDDTPVRHPTPGTAPLLAFSRNQATVTSQAGSATATNQPASTSVASGTSTVDVL